MKSITCDICEDTIETANQSNTKGWSKLKLDHRSATNCGGQVWRFDICPKCDASFSFTFSRKNAKEFVKAIKHDRGGSNGSDIYS